MLGRLVLVSLVVVAVRVPLLPAAGAVRARSLCLQAPAVVLATPLDAETPLRFRLTAVLRGKGLQPGEEIAPTGLDAARVRSFDAPNVADGTPRPRRIRQVLLFLEPTAGGGWAILPGGFRLCSDDGRTLAPTGQGVEPDPETRWPLLLRRVRDDVAALDRLASYRRLGRPNRRVQALLGWVREHRGELTASIGGSDEAPVGWERLQHDLFDWIFESAAPAEAWDAVGLYAELNQGELPRLRSPLFATPAGRTFLVGIATSDNELLGERLRALQLLALPTMLWPDTGEIARGGVIVSVAEQETLLDRLTPLLAIRNDDFRAAVARGLLALSHPASPALAGRRTARVAPALLASYKDSLPGAARDELAVALCQLLPPSQWKELTGNPAGLVVLMRDLERRDGQLTFWLSRSAGEPIHEPPLLVLEKLGTFGFVSQTTRLPVQALNLENGWAAGWKGDDLLAARAELGALAPGTLYRVRVEGVLGRGKERLKWVSEPKRFHVPAQPGPNATGRRGSQHNIDKQ